MPDSVDSQLPLALFHVDGEHAVPTELSRGPWDPNALHGGPVAALLARAVERHDPGPADRVVRVTVDLLRPVPLAPLRVSARSTRPGRLVHWLEAVLEADGRPVAHATALRMRTQHLPAAPGGRPEVPAPRRPQDAAGDDPGLGASFGVGYWTANEVRQVEGSFFERGPGTAWFRLAVPVVAGEEPSPLQRVAAAADFASGVGNPVVAADRSGINADLSIHLHRAPVGEWIALESAGWADDDGVGMVETRLHDLRGPLGRSVQSLLVRARPGPSSERFGR